MDDIGQRIRYFRERLGIGQRELARMLGMQQKRLSEVERGKAKFIDVFLIPMTEALHITPNDLIGITNDSEVSYVNDGHSVPVFDNKSFQLFLSDSLPKDARLSTIPTNGKHSKMAYAVLIKGNTMAPKIEAGDIALIDPKVPAKGGSYVLALDDEGKAVVRLCKYLDEIGGKTIFELATTDGISNPIRTSTKGVQILGTLLEVRKPLIAG